MTKTVFITGGSRGIGEALVRACVGKYNAAFTYNKSEIRALELANEFSKAGGVLAIPCDVSDADSVKCAIDVAKKRFSKIDILINNAGISKSGLFIDMTDEEWREVFAVNVNGVYNTTKAVLPDMLSRGDGAIINVASVWGEVGASMETAYSASKAAVIGFTKALAKEIAMSGVRVNAVAPGAIDTDMLKSYTQSEIKDLCDEIPMGRLGSPEEVAQAILFLARNKYITGSVLDINGGWK